MKTVLLYFLLFTSILFSQQNTETNVMKVGVKLAEPFVMRDVNGNYYGYSIELFSKVAEETKIQFEYVEYELPELFKALDSKKIDIAVGALSITPEREAYCDFTIPYYISGLCFVTAAKNSPTFLGVVQRIFTIDFFKVVLLLTFVLFLAGFLVWLFEKKHNPEQFSDGKLHGLGSGFWWAAVTMTTVGYGDKSPKTFGGRVIAIIWMFVALTIISSFTASIASALTLEHLDTKNIDFKNLRNYTVGTVASTSSEDYLVRRGIDFKAYKNTEEGIRSVYYGDVEILVHETPLCEYEIIQEKLSNDLSITLSDEREILYAFAVQEGSKLRERLNIALLKVFNGREIIMLNKYYFGEN